MDGVGISLAVPVETSYTDTSVNSRKVCHVTNLFVKAGFIFYITNEPSIERVYYYFSRGKNNQNNNNNILYLYTTWVKAKTCLWGRVSN